MGADTDKILQLYYVIYFKFLHTVFLDKEKSED
jgi:hypothetical protein